MKMNNKQAQWFYEILMCELSDLVYNRLTEAMNIEPDEEGFDFSNANKKITFNPNKEYHADTHIFDEKKEFKVKKVMLPKSGVMSYNLYNINYMDINKALKHKTNLKGEPIEYGKIKSSADDSELDSIEYFCHRSAVYIKSLLRNTSVDIITYPQTSKNKQDVGFESFNNKMAKEIRGMFPDTPGIRFVPELLVKNVANIFVNVDVARQVGLSNDEIYRLQQYVEKTKDEVSLINVRKKIDALTDEIAEIVASRGKGRPTKEFRQKEAQLQLLKNDVKLMRMGHRGRDKTVDKNGRAKDWQIKSISDLNRRAIEGIFDINPKYKDVQYKLKGKTVVVFDDNLSSGATLDDICLALQRLGVGKIIPFTIGTIPVTVYGKQARAEHHNKTTGLQ